MTPALQVRNMSKTFGGVQAIADVSFAVAPGTVTALIGPNGAGKTTLFNLITNLQPATGGTVELFGQPIGALTAEAIAGLGLIRAFQTARVFPGMTVVENVAVGAHRLMQTPGWRQMLAATELPMGAQKLLEVIRALMAAPKLLLLDEPAAGLNDTETAELSAMLSAIRDRGITLLVVEHNMSLVMGLADQIVVLDAGRTVAIGPPAEIRRNRAVIEAYVGREDA